MCTNRLELIQKAIDARLSTYKNYQRVSITGVTRVTCTVLVVICESVLTVSGRAKVRWLFVVFSDEFQECWQWYKVTTTALDKEAFLTLHQKLGMSYVTTFAQRRLWAQPSTLPITSYGLQYLWFDILTELVLCKWMIDWLTDRPTDQE